MTTLIYSIVNRYIEKNIDNPRDNFIKDYAVDTDIFMTYKDIQPYRSKFKNLKLGLSVCQYYDLYGRRFFCVSRNGNYLFYDDGTLFCNIRHIIDKLFKTPLTKEEKYCNVCYEDCSHKILESLSGKRNFMMLQCNQCKKFVCSDCVNKILDSPELKNQCPHCRFDF